MSLNKTKELKLPLIEDNMIVLLSFHQQNYNIV